MKYNVLGAYEILKKLELETNVYELTVQDIPIWWFLRWRVYHTIVSKLSMGHDGSKLYNAFCNVPKGIKKIKRVEIANLVFSSIRCIVSLRRLFGLSWNIRNKCLYITAPGFLRCSYDGKMADVFFDTMNDTNRKKVIEVERMTFGFKDRVSLIKRKKAIFLDFITILSTCKSLVKGRTFSKIDKWENFVAECKNVQFNNIENDFIVNCILSVFETMKTQILIELYSAELVLKLFRPRVILITSSYSNFGKALCFYGGKFGTRVIELQHGMINEYHVGYKFFVPKKYRLPVLVPDKILLYGKAYVNKILEKENVLTDDKFSIIGSSHMNEFLRRSRQKLKSVREQVRRNLSVNHDAFVVVFTSQIYMNRELLKFIRDVLEASKNFYVFVKTHPIEQELDGNIYSEIEKSNRVRILNDENFNLYEILIASDAHASISSSVILECLPLGIPNIVIELGNHFEILNLVDTEAVISVKNQYEFAIEIEKLRSDIQYQKKYIEYGLKISNEFFYQWRDEKYCVRDRIFAEVGIS
jgi:hypothetical protein